VYSRVILPLLLAVGALWLGAVTLDSAGRMEPGWLAVRGLRLAGLCGNEMVFSPPS
jgi:hypothetical protein